MKVNSLSDCTTLNNGIKMPWFGLGTWAAHEGTQVENSVLWALEAGYRSIDTAMIYGNERGVGNAIKKSSVPRDDIFVTTKLWASDMRSGKVVEAFDTSLKKLDLEYIDLYLIHWPLRESKSNIKTWKILEKIYKSGRARAIGVSNFLSHHLVDLLDDVEIVPAVDQVEFHPRLQQPDLQDTCCKLDIQLEAWSPIMKGRILDIPELVNIGDAYAKNAVQVTLRWMVQKGIVAIPKSVRKERIHSNTHIFDFELNDEEMAIIESLDHKKRIGENPDSYIY